MKIVYGAGYHLGANIQLHRFLQHSNDEIKIAAYIKNSTSINKIDWILNGVLNKSNFKLNDLNNLNRSSNFDLMLGDIIDWSPDLIISDFEPITAKIAELLNCRLWLCSPLHLLDGISWEKGRLKNNKLLHSVKSLILKLPKAERTFIYSPLADMIGSPIIKNNYEWVRPYFKETKDNINCMGETSLIADGFYSKQHVNSKIDFKDPESLINNVLNLDFIINQCLDTNTNYIKLNQIHQLHEQLCRE